MKKVAMQGLSMFCDLCGTKHYTSQEYKDCKNINSEIKKMFDDLSTYSEPYSKIAAKLMFGLDPMKDGLLYDNRRITSNTPEYLYLVALLYNKDLVNCSRCNSVNKIKWVEGRNCFQCRSCALQSYPCAKTIFHQSTTPLETWFHMMLQMSIGETSIVDLAEMFNLCYKTTHRIYHLLYNAPFYEKLSQIKNSKYYELLKYEISILETDISPKKHRQRIRTQNNYERRKKILNHQIIC